MTVYVDSARIPATVGRLRARWSHLTADTKDELHAFAADLGLRREWFQTCRRRCAPEGVECPHWHYDVTDSQRAEAVLAGAKTVDLRGMADIIRAHRHAAAGGGS